MGKKDHYVYGTDRTRYWCSILERQREMCRGAAIPKSSILEFGKHPGFFFGMKSESALQSGEYIGKPIKRDSHVVVAGESGRGKTQCIVLPTMATWTGSQIILDVKGDLHDYWKQLNKNTGKRCIHFSLGEARCRYDPYAPLRHGGEENLAGNARDLAMALIPLSPSVHDPIWVQCAQNFLTGAIIYYYEMGVSFLDTMVQIQTRSIGEIIDDVCSSENDTAKIYMNKLDEVHGNVISNIGMELSNLAIFVTDSAIRSVLPVANGENKLLDWQEFNTSQEPVDVILTIPEVTIERSAPMIRLMVNQLIKTLEQRSQLDYLAEKVPPILIMLDEFSRIGTLPAIKSGLRTLRSRGVTFALFIQSLADLEENYGITGGKVIAENCPYKVILGASDVASQESWSKLVGTVETTAKYTALFNTPVINEIFSLSNPFSDTKVPIMEPAEFLTMQDIAVVTPEGFFRVEKVPFFKYTNFFLSSQVAERRNRALQKALELCRS